MVNTDLADLNATKIEMSSGGETRVDALADGNMKPGALVGVTDATGKIVGCDIGASELFVGILDINIETDMDTAIVDAVPCKIIIPKSGRKYRIRTKDPGGAVTSGNVHKIADTAGNIEGATNTGLGTAGSRCVNTRALANGDTIGEYRWL